MLPDRSLVTLFAAERLPERLVLLFGILTGVLGIALAVTEFQESPQLDYHAYYFTGRAVLDGKPFVGTAIHEGSLAGSFLTDKEYVYTPVTGPLFAPYGLFPKWQYGYVVNVAVLAATFYAVGHITIQYIERHGRRLARLDRWLILGFTLLSGHTVLGLYRGNVDPIMLLLISLGFLAIQRDAESGVPTTDGGSTTAAAPTSETQTEARSTATTPTQPSQSTSQPPDSNVSTTATPETASEPTESVTQSADSVAQSADSVAQPAESATGPAESATGSATSATQSTASTVDDGHAVDRPTGNTGAETPSSEGVSADTAASESIDRTTVRITEPVGTILGTDEREYTLDKEDVVVLPAANAEALLSKNAAVEIE